ncbi:hypothetical protein P4O66_007669 [Electrophorus voltai]|uniref:Aminoacyl tRNA synthase complex-interacting multifunctional protein 2 n=1 Tax=Electrophorus voltai TaxID=2609070 RepID=A0AAD9E074_9TELE|nr:hypothetical protein P4O66_007669 [Electrophorus voltai]
MIGNLLGKLQLLAYIHAQMEENPEPQDHSVSDTMPMYQLKPICGSDIKIDLPACMYKLPNIHAQQGSGCAEHALQVIPYRTVTALRKQLTMLYVTVASNLSLHLSDERKSLTGEQSQCYVRAALGGFHPTLLSLINSQNGDVDPALKALEARQDEILRKLYDLKAAVDGLAKTVTTPDADLDATTLPQSPTGSPFTGTADLDALLGKDVGALRDIVVNANPANPPFSLLVLHGLLCRRYRVLSSVYVHSSVTSVPPQLLSCLGQPPADSYTRDRFQLGFTLIWKDVPTLQMKFSTPSMCPIEGEANVARFLFRLLGAEPRDPVAATRADCWVDVGIQLAEGSAKERAGAVRALNGALSCSPWLLGSELSLADIVCACSLLWAGQADAAPANVKRWLQACRNLGHFDCVYTLLQ